MSQDLNREAKNSVFIDMFAQDEYRLQLFQTLHPEMTDVTSDDIKTVTLKQVITNHQYNDLAILVKNKLMVFVEAQSTWSWNILLRILLYLVDTIHEYLYENYLDVHATKKLEIPMPEFYVIYTGTQAIKQEISLRKDFFGVENCSIDLTAKVFNVETEDIIGQYIIFCHVLDEQRKKYGPTKQAASETIRICEDRNVLVNYLKDREKEVVEIMFTLLNQEYAAEQFGRAQKEEGREEGEDRMARLILKLQEENRNEDMSKALRNPDYRNSLYVSYGIA